MHARMYWGAIVCGVLASAPGCLRSSETTCDSGTVCPEGYGCRSGGGCFSPAQLSACADLAPGASCELSGFGQGVCVDGGCVVVGCGNGELDPGEVCDDGNAEAGDGCSETCRSLETCGNGAVDVATGESCDCGTDAAPSPGCQRGNSDDDDAECSATCQLRRCGDGALGGVEECDVDEGGALLLREPLDCGSFGFYAGDVTCSPLCRLDLTACVGRCGDGVVDVAAGERCDDEAFAADASCVELGWYGGEPGCTAACQLTGTDDVATCEGRCGDGDVQADAGELCDGEGQATMCAEVGYDAGVAACGLGCGYDLSTCERYGWDHPVSGADVAQVVDAGGWLAYVDNTDGEWRAVVQDGASVVVGPSRTAGVDVESDAVFVVNYDDTAFRRYTRGAAGFEDLADRPPGHHHGAVLALGPDEALTLSAIGGGEDVWRYAAGSWALDLDVGPNVVLRGFAKDAAWVYAYGLDYGPYRAVVYRRARGGGAWNRHELPVTGDVRRLAVRADGEVFVDADGILLHGLSPSVPVAGLSSVRLGGALGVGLFGEFYDQDAATYRAGYLGSLGLVPMQPPPGALSANGVAAITAGVTGGGIYRSRAAIWSTQRLVEEAGNIYSDARFHGAAASAGGVVMWSNADLFERDGLGIRTVVANPGVEITGACRAGAYLYAAIGYDPAVSSGALWIFAANGNQTTVAVGPGAQVACNPSTGEVVAVSVTMVARGTGTSIVATAATTPFSFTPLLAINANGDTYAAHRYGSIYRLEGTTFTEVATIEPGTGGCSFHPAVAGCVEGITVADDGTWTAITADRIVRSAGPGLDPDVLEGAGLQAVFGSSADDVWAVGGVLGAWGTIWHWDGLAWSKVSPPLDEPFYGGTAAADEVVLLTRDRTISLIARSSPAAGCLTGQACQARRAAPQCPT
jgi:cysteine-rich repeat protein